MILRDWRGVAPDVLAACYRHESEVWASTLGWDSRWTWQTVEQARTTRSLPGVVAFDRFGRISGWTFYLVDRSILHIGGVVADAADVTESLVDVVLGAATTAAVGAAACFVLDRAPDLTHVLASRGFEVEPFRYLALSLDPMQAVAGEVMEIGEPWRESDAPAAAALLRAAYTPEAARHFAPFGDWERYVTGLIAQAGCGVFDPLTTRVVREGNTLVAAALMTNVSADTGHLAQLAVHPACRRRGLAARLLRAVCRGASAAGRHRLTLLVGDTNQSARSLYAAAGLREQATFVAARLQPLAGTRRSAAS